MSAATRSSTGLGTSIPIRSGLNYFAALTQAYSVSLSVLEESKELVEHWLLMQGIPPEAYQRLWLREHRQRDLDPQVLRRVHLAEMRATKCDFGLYVDSDPRNIAYAIGAGVTCSLFAHPSYARPEWLPDKMTDVRPWAEIEEEATRQRVLAVTDPRRHDE